jgi:hypothetical protein
MRLSVPFLLSTAFVFAGCNSDTPVDSNNGSGTGTESGTDGETDTDTGDTGEPEPLDTFGFVNGCYSVRSGDTWLAATMSGDAFEFVDDPNAASRFFMKASDLGTYLLYDENGGYLVSDDGPLLRQNSLQSDMMLNDDSYVSGAEWLPENSELDPEQYQLRNRRTDQLLATGGVAAEGLPISFEPATACREHPELTLDASGTVTRTTFDDGDLYGIVDTHSHILSNFAFGGGSLFHGSGSSTRCRTVHRSTARWGARTSSAMRSTRRAATGPI